MKPGPCDFPLRVVFAWAMLVAGGTARADDPVYPTSSVVANQPMGVAKGIFPGRVVWVHNAGAVNQDCVVDEPGHGWFLAENHNQAAVDAMVTTALRELTGATTERAAWTAVFKFHNTTRGKGAVDYRRGEKIFIKTNATSAWSGNFNPEDLTPRAFISETSIATVRAMLRQLVNVVGVDQGDIYVGDPLKHVYKHLYDVWHAEFPRVHFIDNGGYTNLGRENVVPSSTAVIHYSDHGTVLKTNVWSGGYAGDNPVTSDTLYGLFEQAEYLINLPMLKGHRRAGVTMFAKNHFGSHTRADASHLHNGLVAPTEAPYVTQDDYGRYRVLVDIMGHSLLGKKNLLYLMDALWATDYELDVPLRWQMPPFSNGYMASIFASLDPVAIESVGFDFLHAEFTAERVPRAGTYVQIGAVDDYLRQAADPTKWPAGLRYDPDATGTPLTSLGAHEHWNNATARQYSRNLSANGTGIELVAEEQTLRAGPLADGVGLQGDDVSFTSAATGLAPLTFRWERRRGAEGGWQAVTDDAEFAGVTTRWLTVQGATLAMNGEEFRCIVTDAVGASATTAGATLTIGARGAGRLVNLSARAACGTGDDVTIGGFVIEGGSRRVLLRAVGPTLRLQGLRAATLLADPQIELHAAARENAIVAANDDWTAAAEADELVAVGRAIGAGDWAEGDRTSSARLLTLDPGAYSFVASGKAGGTGVVLVEVFDAAPEAVAGGRLTNLSARAVCGQDDKVTIGGFVVSRSPQRVLIRAVGPSLVAQGLAPAAVLGDPQIEVYDAIHGNARIGSNDNWADDDAGAAITATAAKVGARALAAADTTSAAMLTTLAPGVYSFVASGRSGATGIVLIEVYVVD